jgi:protein-S-isoprenylcysteine O-methyltransferase Ste14
MIGRVTIERCRVPLAQVFVPLLIALVLFTRSRWTESAPVVATSLFAIGVVLAAVAALGRTWCSMYIAGYKGRVLVTEGPYSVCRNPLYFFSMLGGIGLGLTAKGVTVPLIFLGGFGLYYSLVIRREEQGLRQEFGREYETYARLTPRFLPKLSLLREPREYVVEPRIFREHLSSAAWFVWLIALAAVVEELHDANVLPSLLALY